MFFKNTHGLGIEDSDYTRFDLLWSEAEHYINKNDVLITLTKEYLAYYHQLVKFAKKWSSKVFSDWLSGRIKHRDGIYLAFPAVNSATIKYTAGNSRYTYLGDTVPSVPTADLSGLVG